MGRRARSSYTKAGPVTVRYVENGVVLAVWEDALPPYSSRELQQVQHDARGKGRAPGEWRDGKTRG